MPETPQVARHLIPDSGDRRAIRFDTTGEMGKDQRFQAYFDNAPECMFQVSLRPDGVFVYDIINAAGLAQAGITLDMARGRTPVQVLGSNIGGRISEGLEQVRTSGMPYSFETTFQYDSKAVIYAARYLPLFSSEGWLVGVLGRAQDITEQRRLEGLLRQAQKMEALGQLVGGVAHDFNNLLAAMAACLSLLRKTPGGDHLTPLLDEADRSLNRGTALTSRLLSFARQQTLSTATIDINACLGDMTTMLGRTLGPTVRIETRLAEDLWPATGDVNQIELAIINLALNARDAMPDGGSLILATRNLAVRESHATGLAPGDYVVAMLTDTGIGMTAETLGRATEPFFTTKAGQNGSGLGLSMVEGTMRQMGGGMEIVSQHGKGTTISLFLRRAAPDGEAVA